jgi:creatinine amidohydrolase
MTVDKYRYADMTWPEIRDVAAEDRVVVVPVGTIEDHGPHLPVDCDVRIIDAITERACRQRPTDTILLPVITHGYSPHHMDFPGPITIRWNVFVEYLLDITDSLIAHGFRRIILANGHGSNRPLTNIAARMTIVNHPEAICCDYFYLMTAKGREALSAVRESEFPGGISHACELETSAYLAIAPDLVQMDKAVKDISFPQSDYFYYDWFDTPSTMLEYWSTLTKNGVMGDPTLATAEKGEAILDAAAEELLMVACELKRREIRPRIDHH